MTDVCGLTPVLATPVHESRAAEARRRTQTEDSLCLSPAQPCSPPAPGSAQTGGSPSTAPGQSLWRQVQWGERKSSTQTGLPLMHVAASPSSGRTTIQPTAGQLNGYNHTVSAAALSVAEHVCMTMMFTTHTLWTIISHLSKQQQSKKPRDSNQWINSMQLLWESLESVYCTRMNGTMNVF